MLGFNKKNPLIGGPVEFEAQIEIGRAAADVFPLLDIADPGFAQTALGHRVTQTGADAFVLVLNGMEDLAFHFKVLESTKDRRHTAQVTIEPRAGNLVSAIEDYHIEAVSPSSCQVKIVTKATFADDLDDEDIAAEMAMMSMAVQDDLTKLKLHAEDGADAVHAFDEERNASFDIEFDLGELDIDWDDIEPEQ